MKKIITYIVLSLSFCTKMEAQDNTAKEALKSYNKANDTVLLKYFRSRAEKNQLKELRTNTIPELFDYNEGTVHYSPDNAFKIFVFSGMNNYRFSAFSSHYSVTQFASGRIEENSGFSKIYSIIPAENGNYIIIDYNTVIASIFQENVFNLEQFKLKNNKLLKKKLVKNNSDLPTSLRHHLSKDNKSFRISLSVKTPFKEDFITYNAMEQKVYYNYIHMPLPSYPAYIPLDMIPSASEHLTVKGSFKLDDGKISGFIEKYEKTL